MRQGILSQILCFDKKYEGTHTHISVLSNNNVLFCFPEAERHQQETQELEENKEKNAQDTIRRTDKKDFLSYGENRSGLTAVIHIQKSVEKYPENQQI